MDNLIIYGRNAVAEALKANRPIDTLYAAENAGGLSELITAAKKAGAVIKETAPEKLNALSKGQRHGGIAALIASVGYASVGDILDVSKQKGTDAFILIADEIEDPHNLGALIRTADCAGADGLIIPKRRGVGVTGAVFAASAGAAAHLKTARVANLTDSIKTLKKSGVWVYGADAGGEPYYNADFRGGVCIVIGSEGRGISRLVRENCDCIISVPMYGGVNSLNASVCGGVLMYEVLRQRGKGGLK